MTFDLSLLVDYSNLTHKMGEHQEVAHVHKRPAIGSNTVYMRLRYSIDVQKAIYVLSIVYYTAISQNSYVPYMSV